MDAGYLVVVHVSDDAVLLARHGRLKERCEIVVWCGRGVKKGSMKSKIPTSPGGRVPGSTRSEPWPSTYLERLYVYEIGTRQGLNRGPVMVCRSTHLQPLYVYEIGARQGLDRGLVMVCQNTHL